MPNPAHQAQNPEVAEVHVTSSAEEVVRIIRRDGGIIIKNFVSRETILKIDEEVAPRWKEKGVYVGNLFNAHDPPLRYVVLFDFKIRIHNS